MPRRNITPSTDYSGHEKSEERAEWIKFAIWLDHAVSEREATLKRIEEQTGVSASAISALRHAKYRPDMHTAIRLAEFFRINPFTALELAGYHDVTIRLKQAAMSSEPIVLNAERDIIARINDNPRIRNEIKELLARILDWEFQR